MKFKIFHIQGKYFCDISERVLIEVEMKEIVNTISSPIMSRVVLVLLHLWRDRVDMTVCENCNVGVS